MSTFSERLQRVLVASGMKQTDIAEATGISKAAISSYLSGKYEPKQGNIYKMAEALHISPTMLLGAWDGAPDGISVGGSADTPEDAGPLFELTVMDGSMSPLLLPGDVLRVRRQSCVQDGALVAVRVSGGEPIVRRIIKSGSGIILSTCSLNGIPPAGYYSIGDLESLPVEILGRVVEMKRVFS